MQSELLQKTSKTDAGLVMRVRALTYTLLPVEVPPSAINDPTSRIITPQVVKAYIAAAGDLVEAVRDLIRENDIGLKFVCVEASVLSVAGSQGVHVGCRP